MEGKQNYSFVGILFFFLVDIKRFSYLDNI